MICHSKLQVRRILLMLVSLPIKTLLGVVFSDQSGVCHISGLIIGQNDWLCIRSYLTTLQITWNLMVINPHLCWDILSYQYLPLKVQRRSSNSVLMRQNQSAQISAQLFLFARVCFLFFVYERQDIHCVPHFLGPFCISLWNEKKKKGLFLPDYNYMQLHIFDVWGYISWGVLCCFVSNQCFCSGTCVKTNKQKWAERWGSTRRKVCAFCLFWPAHQIPQFVLACVCVRLD